MDPLSLMAGLTLLFTFATAGCLRPAWQAWHTDPIAVLRQE